ncbi:hypothetical protein PPL_04441 [Heterostelium album PN500]|uniref:DUF7743 domain-containing protein n=1 Tax=Heterostelium pallidum (strain ATCC 26659 / Pp 5 / PN500) TaxID=670386 RepID=D3B7K3_HETP5|nr:hypothetical protein PPL_04441 [Heterostelium album PN500]EFA82746.1 hypothetical protein PPL_04441 [Heterostelium album PN500]|eukprot:XP_020434863.1 hypothetical protein PPL_04441 [Heterostelium album PN500]
MSSYTDYDDQDLLDDLYFPWVINDQVLVLVINGTAPQYPVPILIEHFGQVQGLIIDRSFFPMPLNMQSKYLSIYVLYFFYIIFFVKVHSLKVMSYEYISENPTYFDLQTGSCLSKMAFKIDPTGCTSPINITTQNGVSLSLDSMYSDIDYQYHYYTIGYYIGQSGLNLKINCTGGGDIILQNNDDLFYCLEVPNFSISRISPWKQTFDLGFQSYESVFEVPELNYTLKSLGCWITIGFNCTITPRFSKSKGYFSYILTLVPLPYQVNYNGAILIINVGTDVKFSQSLSNIFFSPNDGTIQVLKNVSYPNIYSPPFNSYLPSVPVWLSVDVLNPGPFYATKTQIKDTALYPVKGNKKSATLITAVLPSLGSVYFYFNAINSTSTINEPMTSMLFTDQFHNSGDVIPNGMYLNSGSLNFAMYYINRLIPNQMSTYVDWYETGEIPHKCYSKFNFPFGYSNGTALHSFTKSLHPIGNLTNYGTGAFYIDYNPIQYNLRIELLNIKVDSITLTPFGTYSFFIQIGLSEPISGIYKIQIGSCNLFEKDIIFGNLYSGIYEKVCQYDLVDGAAQNLVIEIYSRSMALLSFTPNRYIPTLGTFLPPYQFQFDIPLNEFTKVGFANNIVNVTNLTVLNFFFFNLTSNNTLNYKPILEIFNQDFNGNKKQFTGEWNSTLQLYVIPIAIPMNSFEGLVPYRLLTQPPIKNSEFYSKFGDSSQLILQSESKDRN